MSSFLVSYGLSKIQQNKFVKFFLSAGIATLIDVIAYYIIFNFILEAASVNFNGYLLSGHEFTLCISYTFGICSNFLINKYAVFTESNLKSTRQFSRFITIAFIGFFANYGLLRFFVETCGLWPTFSRICAALSLGIASFYIHREFTFKVEQENG